MAIVAQSALTLKLGPALHSNLAAIKLALVFVASFPGLPVRRLSGVAPGEIVKLPERVGWEHKVPDGQRNQVDQHPKDIRPAVRCDDDQDRWQTENQGEQDERDDLRRRIDDRNND